MLVNGEGGVLRDVDGWVAHHWDWASTNPPLQSLDYKINTNLRLHIDGAGSMTLLFNSFNDAVSLPLMSNLSTFTGHPIRATNKAQQIALPFMYVKPPVMGLR
ncbi:hypothetical protein NDU88_008075 [Pleurodeles waltl]|uniref:FAM194 C-terminal domain-containing protein n=1 Tax=Pleurodeles waltl TaxID=8319 RepID=A0AAV7N3Y9_PLEWA|nr:hypothetical protein NDU88_008075 [Pleurodeles waltl]